MQFKQNLEPQSHLREQRHLVVRVVCAGVGHVVEYVAALEAVPLGHGQQPLGSEGSLGVDVEALALRPAIVDGELACDGQCVAQLRLAGSEE